MDLYYATYLRDSGFCYLSFQAANRARAQRRARDAAGDMKLLSVQRSDRLDPKRLDRIVSTLRLLEKR